MKRIFIRETCPAKFAGLSRTCLPFGRTPASNAKRGELRFIPLILLCLSPVFNVQSQPPKPPHRPQILQHCSTWERQQAAMLKDPSVLERLKLSEAASFQWILANKDSKKHAALTVIPVVVHVVYNTNKQNISKAQVQSQLDILNDDFRRTNQDASNTPAVWSIISEDTNIEFCLATLDPSGNSTDGITRTKTSVTAFADPNMDDVKTSSKGGIDNWDPTRYLNLWVAPLSGSTLGYATFPSDLAASPALDGVVIRYEAFGNTGTAGTGTYSANNLGRTGTHEVGHWLNLRHIWGDGDANDCGNDSVADTPDADSSNFGCPVFPLKVGEACTNDPNGQMFMNYMDYVDDSCMNMFSSGQAQRMTAAINLERSGLLTSGACASTTSISTITRTPFLFFPNPASDYLQVELPDPSIIIIQNMLGIVLKEMKSVSTNRVDISQLPFGIYTLQIFNEKMFVSQKFIISK